MDSHTDILENVCRLCCCKIKCDKKYINAKLVADFDKEIQKVF